MKLIVQLLLIVLFLFIPVKRAFAYTISGVPVSGPFPTFTSDVSSPDVLTGALLGRYGPGGMMYCLIKIGSIPNIFTWDQWGDYDCGTYGDNELINGLTPGIEYQIYFAYKINGEGVDQWYGSDLFTWTGVTPTPTPSPIPTNTPTPTPPSSTPTPTPILEPLPIASVSAQLQSMSLIYYKLYMKPFGPCSLYTSCGQDLMMTIYNNTDDWEVTRVNWTPNYGFTGITPPAPLQPATIDSYYTGFFYYNNDHNLQWLKDRVQYVSFVIHNIYTDEIYEIPAPGEGQYTLIDPTTSGGLTKITSVLPSLESCGLIDLGLIRIPDFFCEFKQWVYGFIYWLFVPDMTKVTNKITQLQVASEVRFPFNFVYSLRNIHFDSEGLIPYGASVSAIPEFNFTYDNKYKNATVNTINVQVTSDQFSTIVPFINKIRMALHYFFILMWLQHIIFLLAWFLARG